MGARNVLSYARRMMQNFPALKDSPIIPLGRSPVNRVNKRRCPFPPSFSFFGFLYRRQG